jgi:predicted RNase H-like HicB family nuclease
VGGLTKGITMTRTFTAFIEYDPESSTYIGSFPGIQGAHTVGDTMDELLDNLREVLDMCLEEYSDELDDLPRFVGVQQFEVAV